MFMALVVAAFRFAWHPFFLSTSKEENAPQIFARVMTYFLVVTGWVFVAISLFINEIVQLKLFGIRLFGEGFTGGLSIVPVVLLAYVCYGMYIHFIVGVYLKKKTFYLPIATGIGAIVGVVMNFVLVPQFEIMGAAWATFSAYFVMAVVLYVVNQHLYPIRYEFLRILKIVFVVSLIFAIQNGFNLESHLSIRILLAIGYFPLLWMFRFLTVEEKVLLKKKLAKAK
jgi:O-antigen/teichoic acid export membrane protein